MSAYILVFGKLHEGVDAQAFEKTFEQVSSTLVHNTPGLLRDVLLRDSNTADAYILFSEWRNKEAWAMWQRSSEHEQEIRPLQQYWRGQGVKVCDIAYIVDNKDVQENIAQL